MLHVYKNTLLTCNTITVPYDGDACVVACDVISGLSQMALWDAISSESSQT